jgi:F-type H+-transporting ATPase subunit epsilon
MKIVNDIIKEVEKELQSSQTKVSKKNVGYVTEVKDEVVFIDGLSDSPYGEMVDFEGSSKKITRLGYVVTKLRINNMKALSLKIITPKKVVLEDEVYSVTAPGMAGELTILPTHIPLFAVLKEGVVTIRKEKDESLFSIGGGYIETDGKTLHLLVSRAFGQDELDEKDIEEARKKAEKLLSETKDETERQHAMQALRRSFIDMKVLKRVRRKGAHPRV